MALTFPLTPLIGRTQEIKAVCASLQQPHIRLLTLTGPGGIGKTRLGSHIATQLQPAFVDGTTFLSLALLQEPHLVLTALLQTLNASSIQDMPALTQLTRLLCEKQQLLFLDNLEQVITIGPALVELLLACPGIKILVTSRVPLHVRGEYEFPVPPLAVPVEKHVQVEQVLQSDAVTLFVHYAQTRQPNFQVTASNAATIAAICIRLDGIPLALELAAAHIKVLPPQALLARLKHRLPLLTNRAQDAPPRQKTMRNTIKWSYDLLTEQEQRLFRYCSIFAHGCSLAAIQALSVNDGLTDTLNEEACFAHISALIEKNMLQQVSQGDEPRLMLLETMREYGLECLEECGELSAMQRLHASYYLALAQEAEHHLSNNQPGTWFTQLTNDYHNLLAALQWSLAQQTIEEATHLCIALWWYWSVSGAVSEGRYWLKQVLHNLEHISPPLRAIALDRAGDLAFHQGDYEQAEQHCQASLLLFRALHANRGCAIAFWRLGRIAWIKQAYATAQTFAQQALALFKELHDSGGVADTLLLLSYIAHNQGEQKQARLLAEKSLALFRANDDTWGTAYVLLQLARIALAQHDNQAAHILIEESMVLSQKLTYKGGVAISLAFKAQIAAEQKEYQQAIKWYEESIALLAEIGDTQAIVTYQQERDALQLVLASTPTVSPTTSPTISTTTFHDQLTAREKEVLRLLASGMSDVQIATKLVISPRTVNGHLTAIYRKLHISSRSEATRYALEHSLA